MSAETLCDVGISRQKVGGTQYGFPFCQPSVKAVRYAFMTQIVCFLFHHKVELPVLCNVYQDTCFFGASITYCAVIS